MDFLEKSNHREEMNTTVAHASGSESSVLFPRLISASACSSFRVPASVFSVKFRVIPWQMLILSLISV